MFTATLYTIAKLWKQPSASLQTNGLGKCGIYPQWTFTQPQRMKFYHSQVNGWDWRTSRLRRPKMVCSPSYVEYRHGSYAKGRTCGRNRKRGGNLKFESV
jgi:hypothetical protein